MIPSEEEVGESPVGYRFDGVWLFEYDPQLTSAAAHGGTVSIVDGCLEVGGAVVIWHVSLRAQVHALVSAMQEGETPKVTLGGHGKGRVPIVDEHCPGAARVWLSSHHLTPGVEGFEVNPEE
jgi:hypothetical protein